MSILPGKVVSHYRILEEIGRGGMGVVYKAEDMKLKRTVALKFLPQHVSASEEEKARFIQEAQAASALNHPNVCTIHDIQEYDKPAYAGAPAGRQMFIVMEFVDGMTLRSKLPFRDLQEAVQCAIQIGEALGEAHSKGIIHRDVKSENIMINSRNQVKVMDFGLAKLRGSVKLTRTSSTTGTLAYMAPEQIQGGEVNARSDIFSFGVVLYEMLTQRLPFRGEHEAAMMYSILNEEPEPAQKYLPGISSELLYILGKALEKDPGDRYQSVSEMVIDLRRLQKQSTRVSRTQPLPEATTGRKDDPGKQDVRGKRASMLLGKNLWIGILSAAVLAAASLWMYTSTKNTAVAPFQSMQIKRMTTIGTAANATISPDGKYIVHSILRDGKRSLWVRQVATTSNVEIVPPEVTEVVGTTFSNDGNYVYYVLRGQRNPDGSLFVVPVLGGTPKKVLTNIRTPIALSPDGRQCVFVRQNNENRAEERLVIASIAGSVERKLASRFGEEFFIPNDNGPSWSSDGKHVATCIGTTKGGFQCRVAVYSVDDGHEEFISPVSWSNLGRVAWLHDGSGIVLTARDSTDVRSQLWHLSFPGGQVRHITNDLNSYGTTSLSLTSDDQALVSVQTELLSDIWAIPDGNLAQGRKLTSSSRTLDGNDGLSLTPDGRRIVYTSASSGNNDIWIMDDDGGSRKQLTTDSRADISPSVTSDGKAILFASSRSGTSNIWMMDLEGSNMKQITTSEDYYATSSPDGKWVVYFGFGAGYAAVWKVPMNGGTPQQLTRKTSSIPAVSHDSRFVACIYVDKPNEWGRIAIFSIDGGEPLKLLDIPATADRGVLWSPDGKAILYLNTDGGVSNIWSQPIDGSPPKRVTSFTEGQIFDASFTPDGKKLVCSRGNTVSDVVMITGFR